jgi:uncharacterized protein YkwD
MRLRVILINLLTLALVCFSLVFMDKTNTLDYLANKKDAAISAIENTISGTKKTAEKTVATSTQEASSTIQTINKVKTTTVQKKAVAKVLTPGPLEVKDNVSKPVYSGGLTIQGVIDRTNYERQKYSLSGLTESSELDASAQVKANDILARQYFEHTSPDGKGVSDLVSDAGYAYVRVGENLALGSFSNEVDLLTAWMNSPGHKANILDTRFQDIGIGIAFGNYQGKNVLVSVQHFGRPRTSCPSIDDNLKTQVTNLQSQAVEISTSLDSLKAQIDAARANGQEADSLLIAEYNKGVVEYDLLISKAKKLRDAYNVEVVNFNTCLAAL